MNSTCIFWSKLGVTMSILHKQSSFDRGSQSLHFLTKSVLEGISPQGKLAHLVHMLLHLRCHLPLPQLFFRPPQLPTGCFLGCFLAPHGCSEWPSSPSPWLQAPPWVSHLHSQLRPPPKLQIHDSDHLLDSTFDCPTGTFSKAFAKLNFHLPMQGHHLESWASSQTKSDWSLHTTFSPSKVAFWPTSLFLFL